MKTHPQANESMSRLAELLGHQRVAMLTFDEAGQGLRGRPLTALEMDGGGAIWFMISRKSLAAAFAAGSVAVNLAFIDEPRSDFVSIAGIAELVDSAQRKSDLWTAAARPWFDGPEDPDLTLLRVTPQHADLWDGPDSAAVRVLAMAASVAASRPLGLGHHESVEPAATR